MRRAAYLPRMRAVRSYVTPPEYHQLTTPNGITYKQPTGLFIGGEFVPSASGASFESENPATESPIVTLSEANSEDVDRAVDAAEAATKEWLALTPYERGRIIYKIGDLIEQNTDLLASVETWDNGKTLAMARGDITGCVAAFHFYAGYADKINGSVVETDNNHFNYVRKEPIGVCGMVIPWNFPLMMLTWKIAPALAAGNTCVMKTAESTPLTALIFAELCNKAGLPKGVVNILSGYGEAGAAISAHPRIKKVAFTGSTMTGRKIMESAAKSNLKKVTLELGGKSPNIVFDDCQLDKAVDATLLGIFYNQGEVCCAGTRLFLQNGIHDEFLDALKAKVEKLQVGDPFDPNTYYGPQTNKLQYEKILGYVKKGMAEGATVLTGGKPAPQEDGKGYFIKPTIFTNVKNTDTIAREEIFGPVLSVISFDTVEEAVKGANDTDYGLASGVHTTDLNKAIYVANNLKAGTVWVNTYNEIHHQVPFGGYGESGIGRELGEQVLSNYLETKSVRIAGVESSHFN